MQTGRTSRCTFCEATFTVSLSRRIFCSEQCKTRFARENKSCFYCGEIGDSRDHVVPHSLTANRGSKRQWSADWVYCCSECNGILGNYLGGSFHDRIMYLHDRFKRKKKLHKSFVEWDDEELEDVSAEMRNWILGQQNQRKLHERRLSHMRLTAIKVAKFEEDQEAESTL